MAPLADDKAVSPSRVLGKMLGSPAGLPSYSAPLCQANMLGSLETSRVGKTSSTQFFPALWPRPCFKLRATSSSQPARARLEVAGGGQGCCRAGSCLQPGRAPMSHTPVNTWSGEHRGNFDNFHPASCL